jgi:anthranilate synthase component II
MLLVIDNFDSFTYNLVQYLGELGGSPQVFRNDAITIEEIAARDFDGIVISPGPGAPCDAGISIAAIRAFAGRLPILGVCLGHQAIAEAFGGCIVRAPAPVHGKPSTIQHVGVGVFAGLSMTLDAGRYHSLMIERATLPAELEITAETTDGSGIIMGVRHRKWDIEGVQFHPESILTPTGMQMLATFVERVRLARL